MVLAHDIARESGRERGRKGKRGLNASASVCDCFYFVGLLFDWRAFYSQPRGKNVLLHSAIYHGIVLLQCSIVLLQCSSSSSTTAVVLQHTAARTTTTVVSVEFTDYISSKADLPKRGEQEGVGEYL